MAIRQLEMQLKTTLKELEITKKDSDKLISEYIKFIW